MLQHATEVTLVHAKLQQKPQTRGRGDCQLHSPQNHVSTKAAAALPPQPQQPQQQVRQRRTLPSCMWIFADSGHTVTALSNNTPSFLQSGMRVDTRHTDAASTQSTATCNPSAQPPRTCGEAHARQDTRTRVTRCARERVWQTHPNSDALGHAATTAAVSCLTEQNAEADGGQVQYPFGHECA
jgi:hypothetical protein